MIWAVVAIAAIWVGIEFGRRALDHDRRHRRTHPRVRAWTSVVNARFIRI